MAKSKNKLNKNKSKPNFENIKPILIEETIEKMPPRTTTALDRLLNNFPGNALPLELGDMKILFRELDFDEDDEDYEDYEAEFKEYTQKLLGTKNIQVNQTNLKKYFSHLKNHLKIPCWVTVIDVDLLDEEDYLELGNPKQKGSAIMPVEDKIYNLVKLNNQLNNEYGILVDIEPARVKRGKDKPRLTVPLAQLEAYDPTSDNYELLENYSIWFFGE